MRGVNPLAFFSGGVKPKNGFSMIKILERKVVRECRYLRKYEE